MNLLKQRLERNGDERDPMRLVVPSPPANRGRLLYVEDVRQELLGGRKSASWVRHHFAPEFKHKLGRDDFWYDDEAHEWLRSRREGA